MLKQRIFLLHQIYASRSDASRHVEYKKIFFCLTIRGTSRTRAQCLSKAAIIWIIIAGSLLRSVPVTLLYRYFTVSKTETKLHTAIKCVLHRVYEQHKYNSLRQFIYLFSVFVYSHLMTPDTTINFRYVMYQILGQAFLRGLKASFTLQHLNHITGVFQRPEGKLYPAAP
jgi:hypothetical protein